MSDLVPTHGDPSYTNFLVIDIRTFLVDWDDLMLADPLRDIGPLLWWYVLPVKWNAFFLAYGLEPTERVIHRLFWRVTEHHDPASSPGCPGLWPGSRVYPPVRLVRGAS
ncbi:MAG: phosphotransferase [Chloroflexi bacterium]|nr:phosphotransferase [Chloroflexota bacterium]